MKVCVRLGIVPSTLCTLGSSVRSAADCPVRPKIKYYWRNFTSHTQHITGTAVKSSVKRYKVALGKKECIPKQTGWMDGWMTCNFIFFQQYFSHIRTMGV